MNDLIQKKSELALIYAVPILSNAKENSRLAGLLRKLQKAVLPVLQNMPEFTKYDLRQMINKIAAWGEDTGWLNDNRHTSVLVSFCVDMVEKSPFKYPDKVLQTLNDIADHMENGKMLQADSCFDDAVAAEKWEKLFTKEL